MYTFFGLLSCIMVTLSWVSTVAADKPEKEVVEGFLKKVGVVGWSVGKRG